MDNKTTRGCFHIFEPFPACWECFSGYVEDFIIKEGDNRTFGVRPSPGEPWFTLPASGEFSRTSLFPDENVIIHLAINRDIEHLGVSGIGTFFSLDTEEILENFLHATVDDSSKIREKKEELQLLLKKERVNAKPVFFKEGADERLLGMYHPLLPLAIKEGENEEERFDQCLRDLKIRMKKEAWDGPAAHVSPFPQPLVSPPEIAARETGGRAIPLSLHGFRFRSLPGVHHCVTHYIPGERTFRVLTGLNTESTATKEVENCFEQYWKGEDVLLSLFCDRFLSVKDSISAIQKGEENTKPLSLSPLSSVVFAFLEFCRIHDAGAGEGILDKKPIHRPSGIAQNRPLFPLFAEMTERLLKTDGESSRERVAHDARVRTFITPLVASLSAYSNINLEWEEKEWDEQDKVWLILRKTPGKHRLDVPLSPDVFSEFIGLFSPPPKKELFSRTQGKGEGASISPLESFLLKKDNGKQVSPKDLLPIFILNDRSVRTLLPGALPVIDINKKTPVPRKRKYSLPYFLFRFAPDIHKTLFGDAPETGELLCDFLTRGNLNHSSLKDVFRQYTDKNFYLPDIVPVPPEKVSCSDVNPRDAIGFLQSAWLMNKLVFETANSLELSVRYSAMSNANSVYGDVCTGTEEAKNFFFRGLTRLPEGRTPEESLEWLDCFKTLYKQIAEPVADRISEESNLRPVFPAVADKFCVALESVKKELCNIKAIETILREDTDSRWRQDIL